MKRIIPEFRSKSESKTLVSGKRDKAKAAFKAIVEVPTPALAGRKLNTSLVHSMAGGRAWTASLIRTSPSVKVWRLNGSEGNSRLPAPVPSTYIFGVEKP